VPPYERRLKDLANILKSCAITYFDPDLFRQNTNQFLQTSRTVTFLIQKQKSAIPNFDAWYLANMSNEWRSDDVMTWAKESRNFIEKEGDLEIHSSMNATLLFSYLVENDLTLQTGTEELLHANVKRLIRLAQKRLPSGVSDAAAVKIERQWITSSLPNWELLNALVHVFERIYTLCQRLARYLDLSIDAGIPTPQTFHTMQTEAMRVEYVKVNGLSSHHIKYDTVKLDPTFQPPESFTAIFDDAQASEERPANLQDVVSFYSKMTRATFESYGNHVAMLFLFDSQWRGINMMSINFEDQADKFIIWRLVAERVSSLNAHAVVWISEKWIRSMKHHLTTAIRNLEIVGERLSIAGLDRTGATALVEWDVIRTGDDSRPTLVLVPGDTPNRHAGTNYFLVPIRRAMGLPDPDMHIDRQTA
jgi:hypothetical protein